MADFTDINDQSIPPQNVEAEESILGGILLDPEAIARVAEILSPEAFYVQAHQMIYKAAIALHNQKQPTDLMTLTTWLEDNQLLDKVGGRAKLAQLADRTVSAVNIDGYAQLVLDKYLRRQLIASGYKIVQLGFDTSEGLNQVLDRAEQNIFQITQDRPQSGLVPLQETLLETYDEIEGRYNQDKLPGLQTGFYDLDSMTSGLQPSDLIILAGRPSMGKCLGKGTKVVMFDGTLKAVEDIQVNDQLMGPDSKPRKVLSLARGREMMYWVYQKRGVDYRVNESHILSLKASGSERRRVHGEVVNISVQDYLTKSQKFQQRHKGYKVAIDFPPQIVPIDPYLLGLWLGDGKLGDSRIFNLADEVIAELGVIAVREGYRLSHQPNGDRCDAWNLCAGENPEGFKIQLRRAQLLDKKWIPLCYLANTKEVRLELLAGLMDSDGYYCKDMQCFENTQKSKKLADQIKFLADSLGFRTSIIRKQGSIKTSNFCGEYWRVRVSGNLEIIPTRIQYKKARNYASGRDWQVTGITIKPDGVDDYYGFELDGDGLFLLEDMTVTHNTAFGLNMARNLSGNYNLPVALFSLEMSKEQLSQRLLASEAQVESNRLRSGRLTQQDYQKLSRAIGTLSEVPIYIDDTATLTVMEMRSQARRLQAERGQLGLILLDYLQLMEGGGDNRVQELSRITRSLKTLAREVKAPVIALSQLSRGVEQRTNKRPMLSDLRESGCLSGDTRVTLADTGKEVAIKELVGQSQFNVWAVNPKTWKLEKTPVSRVFCTGFKQTFQLETALGRRITATGNHKFLTLDGWKRLDELNIGDYIALPRYLSHKNHGQTMEKSEVALLGHLIGDGCTLPKHAIQYTTKEKDLANLVFQLASTIFTDTITPRVVKEKQWYQVYLSSSHKLSWGKRNPITQWLYSLKIFGLRSYEKFIPELIFQQPESIIATFLCHLWSTDGCIKLVKGKRPRPVAYYTSSSLQLAQDVQSLLLRLGINARLSSKLQKTTGRDQYNVTITGKPRLSLFIDKISAVGNYKQNSLQEIANYLEKSIPNPNQDIIPHLIWKKYAVPAMKKNYITNRQMQLEMGCNYCGTTLYKSNLSRERATLLGQVVKSSEISKLATSDIYWDKITSITKKDTVPVYDLTVPKLHNFVANNMIVHNSIEQDADLVVMLYRDAYYNPDTPDRDLAEVIITKHRNGPTGTVKLLFNSELTEFRNVATRE